VNNGGGATLGYQQQQQQQSMVGGTPGAPTTPQSNIILIANRHVPSQLYVLKCEYILSHSDWNERCYRELLVYRALRNLVLGRRSPHFVNLLDWWKSYGGPMEKNGMPSVGGSAKRRINRRSRQNELTNGEKEFKFDDEDPDSLYPEEADIPHNNRKKLMKHEFMNFVLEKADGTLAKYLQEHDNCLSPFLFKYILFQLFFALYQAQSDCEFVHNDLHLSNILFLRTNDADKYCYHVEHATFLPGRFNRQDAQILIKITDFGNSRARLSDTADIVYNASLDQHSQFHASVDIEKIMSEVRTVRVDWDSLPAEEAQTQKVLYQKLRLESGKIGVQPRDLLRHEYFNSFKITDGYDPSGQPSSYMIHYGDFMQPVPMPANDFDDMGGNQEGEYYEPGASLGVKSSRAPKKQSSSDAMWTKCGRMVLKSNNVNIGSIRLFSEGGALSFKPASVNITKLMPVDKFDKIPLQNVDIVYFEPLLDSNKQKLRSLFNILKQESMCGTTDADPTSDHIFCLLPSTSRFVRKFELKGHPFVGAFIFVDPSHDSMGQSLYPTGGMVQPSPFLAAQPQHGADSMLTPSPFMAGGPPQHNAVPPQEIQPGAAPYPAPHETYPPQTYGHEQYPPPEGHRGAPPPRAYHEDYPVHHGGEPLPHNAPPPPPVGGDHYDAYAGSGRAPSVQGSYYDRPPPMHQDEGRPYPPERYTPDRYSSLPPHPSGMPPHGAPPPYFDHPPHPDDARMYDRYGSPPRHGPYHHPPGPPGRPHMDLKRKRSPSYYDRDRFGPFDEPPRGYPGDRFSPERYPPHKKMRHDDEYYHRRGRRSYTPPDRRGGRRGRRNESPRADDDDPNKVPSHFIKIKEPTNSIWIGLKRYHDMFPDDSLQDCFKTLRKDFGDDTLINLLPQQDKVSPKCAFLNFTSVEKAKEAYAFIEKVKYKVYPSLRYTVPRKDARNSMH